MAWPLEKLVHHQRHGGRNAPQRVEYRASLAAPVIEDYLKRSGIDTSPSMRRIILPWRCPWSLPPERCSLPAYARNFLPWSVTSRPLAGDVPVIDLVVGYNKANRSPILKLFLSRIDDLIARVSNHGPDPNAVPTC